MKKVDISSVIGKLSKADQAIWLKERKKSKPDVDWDEGMKKFDTKSK